MSSKRSVSDPRRAALDALQRLDAGATLLELDLSRMLRGLGLSDTERALSERLVKGVLESRSALDAELNGLLSKGLSSLPPPVRNVLRLGLYQLRGLDRIPKEVAVSETVNLAKSVTTSGLAKVVNAVLRRAASVTPPSHDSAPSDLSPKAIAARHSHPEWLVERWCAEIGPQQAEALCVYDNRAWPIGVRVNTLVLSIAEALDRAQAEGVVLSPGGALPECFVIKELPANVKAHELKLFKEGALTIQDESACIAAHLVAPEAGELVVDLCSAPGGKTTHLAQLMQNTGRIIAVDLSEKRLMMVRENCERLHVTNVECLQADGMTLSLPMTADRVLVDAPCSGLGTLGRKKDLRWKKTIDDLEQLHHLQVDLLIRAAALVRPGGRLVYTTCSVDRLENEGTVESFLGSHPEFSLVPVTETHRCGPFATESGMVRTWPHRHLMSGSFGAVFSRAGS